MTDYLKKYQSGGELPTLSDMYIKNDLSYIEPTIKKKMAGLSRSVFEGSELLELDTTVKDLRAELQLRNKGEEGSPKYKDKSTEKLIDTYGKLDTFLDRKVKDKTRGYAESIIKYVNGERDQVNANSKYTPEDIIKLNGFFDKKIREWNKFADDTYEESTVENIKKIMSMKEIGFTSPVPSNKNGGKLVTKHQAGSMLGDGDTFNEDDYTTGIESPVETNSYITPFKSLPGLKLNTSAIPKNGFGSPSKQMGDYSGSNTPDLGTNKTAYLGDALPEKGTFGNQTDRSFGQGKYKSKFDNTISTPAVTTTSKSNKLNDILNTNGPVLSRTGINTPIGGIQYNDIAQFLLARNARNKPVAVAPVHQEEFTSSGSRNVRSISGIDSSIRNKAMDNIASIGGRGYQGSDPIMNMITNLGISNAKRKAKSEFIGKEAMHLENEKARYDRESEEQRKQVAADRVANTKVKNANELAIAQGKWKTAQAEAEKESQYSKNLGAIFSTIQGRWNADSKQRNTAKAAMWRQDRDREYANNQANSEALRSEISNKDYQQGKDRADKLKYLQSKQHTDKEIEGIMKSYDDNYASSTSQLRKDRASYQDKLNSMSETNSSDILQAHDESKEGLFRWGKKNKNKNK